jgi:pimeloyl-ACP methyl ester carboxylesterase
MKRMGAFIAGKVFPEDDEIEFRERMAEAWAKNDKRAYTAATKALIGWSVLARLDEISIPTLVITGTEAYSPSLVTEPLLAEIAGVQIEVIEGARHAAPVQQPEQFNQILLDFFKRL